MQLLSASDFTIEELTAAYNQTRVDYLVPMPMNAARLASYVQTYDVCLDASLVAVAAGEVTGSEAEGVTGGWAGNGSASEDGQQPAGSTSPRGEMLGLAMLGLRPGRVWVTRLGVLPVRRRHGAGEALVRGLLAGAEQRGIGRAILEVIKGNVAAHSLFLKLGFRETRELLVLRRPPNPPPGRASGEAAWLEQAEALRVLESANLGLGCENPAGLAWTNELESFQNVEDMQGLRVDLGGQGRGWLVYRRERFVLSHFIFHSEAGDPRAVGEALLSQLYHRYPLQDTYIENLPADDPHGAALAQYGCLEVFRRVEMVRDA